MIFICKLRQQLPIVGRPTDPDCWRQLSGSPWPPNCWDYNAPFAKINKNTWCESRNEYFNELRHVSLHIRASKYQFNYAKAQITKDLPHCDLVRRGNELCKRSNMEYPKETCMKSYANEVFHVCSSSWRWHHVSVIYTVQYPSSLSL